MRKKEKTEMEEKGGSETDEERAREKDGEGNGKGERAKKWESKRDRESGPLPTTAFGLVSPASP